MTTVASNVARRSTSHCLTLIKSVGAYFFSCPLHLDDLRLRLQCLVTAKRVQEQARAPSVHTNSLSTSVKRKEQEKCTEIHEALLNLRFIV
jgi:hypothetical protein